ncbi:MAG: MFS transporter [Thermoleophilia bacterium]|nr:MFS transporter [Thermoleophilia bacterium]
MDQTIFSTALPTVVGDLAGVDQMLWVATAYLLAGTIMMPIYGKLGDLFGHKLLLLSALALFLGGSVLGGLAPGIDVLIAARAVQGLGGGGLMILSQSVIADIVPPRQRGTYMGIMAGAWAFASVLGPVLGGWFADSIGWRWAFWFNLPLGLIAVLAVWAYVRMPLHKKARRKLDIPGMMTLAVATTTLILVISWGGREYPWDSPLILGLLGLAVVVAVLLVFVERRAAEPVIPLHLFRDRNFNLVTAGALFSSVAFLGVIVYMPSYLQMVTGLSATKAGLLVVPLAAGIQVGSLGSGIIASRTGKYRWMPALSVLLIGISLVLLSTLDPDTSLTITGIYLFICGIGTGIGFQILVLIVQNSFPITQVGTATGAHNFFRQIGASVGSAVVGTLFTGRLMDLLGDRLGSWGTGSGGMVDPHSLTPAMVGQMPEDLKTIVITSYNEALAPVYLYVAPLMLVAFVLFIFIRPKPLGLTNEIPVNARSTDKASPADLAQPTTPPLS